MSSFTFTFALLKALFMEFADLLVPTVAFIVGWVIFRPERAQQVALKFARFTGAGVKRAEADPASMKLPLQSVTYDEDEEELDSLVADLFSQPDREDLRSDVGGLWQLAAKVDEASAGLFDDLTPCSTSCPIACIDSPDGYAFDLWEMPAFDTPQEAMTSDVDTVLENAISTHSSELADAALETGSRLCSAVWLAHACNQLRTAGIQISIVRAIELTIVFGRETRGDLAVDLWHHFCHEQGAEPHLADETTGLPPLPELYGAALEACARCGDFETAARLVRSAGWLPPPLWTGQNAYLALARWLARRQEVSRAMDCYNAIRRAGGAPDLPTHRAVLTSSVRAGDMPQASNLFQELVHLGITPDASIFSAMVCGHSAAGNFEQAMSYFHMMQSRGIIPDASLFDTVLDGCAMRNMPTLVEQVLSDMENAGVKPSNTTLSILMRRYGNNQDIDGALAAFEDFPKRHSFDLDGQAYGTLISVCLSNHSFDLAYGTYERMRSAGFRTKARIYEAMIVATLRRGDLELALQVVDEALCLSRPVFPTQHVRLDPKVVDELLQMVGKRGHAQSLGTQLMKNLKTCGMEVSEQTERSILRAAAKESSCDTLKFGECYELYRRGDKFQSWREGFGK